MWPIGGEIVTTITSPSCWVTHFLYLSISATPIWEPPSHYSIIVTRTPSPDLSTLWPRTQDPPRCWHPSMQRDTGQWDAANNCIAHYSVSTQAHLNPGFAFTAHCSKIVSTFSAIFYKFSRNNKQSKALFNEQTYRLFARMNRWLDNKLNILRIVGSHFIHLCSSSLYWESRQLMPACLLS